MSTLLDDLEAHLGAIRARALDRLEATLAPERLTLVTAAGEVMGRDEFLRLHSEWFESDSWSIDTEIVEVHEGSDLALCVLRLRYVDSSPEGGPVDETSILSLGFERAGDRWLVSFDQNTPALRGKRDNA
jgi:ketosteroid isomerase-like protein